MSELTAVIRQMIVGCYPDLKSPEDLEKHRGFKFRKPALTYSLEFMAPSEKPLMVVAGDFREESSSGYLWATDRRVFYAGRTEDDSLIFKKEPFPVYREFSYGDISHVDCKGTWDDGFIYFYLSTNSARGHVAITEFHIRYRSKMKPFADGVSAMLHVPIP